LTRGEGRAFNGPTGRSKEAALSEDDDPGRQPPKDINLAWLLLLGGLFFLFVLLAGIFGLTP
jgi:hypothetical protein